MTTTPALDWLDARFEQIIGALRTATSGTQPATATSGTAPNMSGR